ncbi:MAG: hypothetical protein CMJ24_03795 [Phycisphaerae bacterium]|nr:hypothetical protein [Phycisphaerae bacterium]
MVGRTRLRTILIKSLLGSLILNALLGILVVIDEGESGRLALTSVVLSIGIALILLGTSMLQTPRRLFAGYGICASTLIQMLLATILIWGEELDLRGSLAERLQGTWGTVFWTTVLLMPALLMIGRQMTRWMGLMVAAGTALCSVLVLLNFWTFTFDLEESVVLSILICSWVGSPSLLRSGTRLAAWQYLGIAGAVFTAAAWIVIAYMEIHRGFELQGSTPLSATVAVGLSTATVGLIALGRVLPLPGSMSWLRWSTILAFVAAFSGQVVTIATNADYPSDTSTRITLALYILATCSLLALLVVSSVQSEDRSASTAARSMRIHCPACGKKQTREMGRSECEQCRQPIWLWCRMVDCPECRYDLTGTTSPNCPECGTTIRIPLTPPDYSTVNG